MKYQDIKITARNDYAFKKLFSRYENKDILIEFISLVTGIKKEDFDEIKLQNKEIGKEYYDEKYGIVDVKVRLKSGVKINIEMQNKYYSYYPKRSLYYWAKIFTEDIKETNLYKELNKTISINLLNENFPKTEKIHSTYRIYEENEYTLLDDSLEIHYLDMTKLSKKENLNELEKWLLFLQTDKKEVRDMLSSENKTLEKANKVIDMFYSDDMEREMYMTAEKYEMDRYFINLENYEKGVEKGKKEGIEEEKNKIAKELKKQGIDISVIEKVTGFSREEITAL